MNDELKQVAIVASAGLAAVAVTYYGAVALKKWAVKKMISVTEKIITETDFDQFNKDLEELAKEGRATDQK